MKRTFALASPSPRRSGTAAFALSAVLFTAITLCSPQKARAQEGESGGGRNVAVGLDATLTPGLTGGRLGIIDAIVPAISLRMWFDEMMVEPLLGFSIIGRENSDAQLLMQFGCLVGYALSLGRLRPVIGGGLRLGFSIGPDTGGNPDAIAMTFGPFLGLEYRFEELPDLGLGAAVFLPITLQFDPLLVSISTSGAVMAGFHYYF